MAEKIKKNVDAHGDGQISRREFIHKSVLLTGSLAAAGALHDLLETSPAHGAQVDPNDPALSASEIKFPGYRRGFDYGLSEPPQGRGKTLWRCCRA